MASPDFDRALHSADASTQDWVSIVGDSGLAAFLGLGLRSRAGQDAVPAPDPKNPKRPDPVPTPTPGGGCRVGCDEDERLVCRAYCDVLYGNCVSYCGWKMNKDGVCIPDCRCGPCAMVLSQQLER